MGCTAPQERASKVPHQWSSSRRWPAAHANIYADVRKSDDSSHSEGTR